MHRQILYFSVLQQHRDDFKKKIRPFEHSYDFKIMDEGSFSHASDLLLFLEEVKYHNILRRLYVVVDYFQFFADEYNYEDEADAIRRAILGFPEVFFLFDETYDEDEDFIAFLFKKRVQSDMLAKDYHRFNMNYDPPKGLCALANQRTNLFDGTNLRYCLKAAIYDTLDAHQNFKRIQTSRSKNLAICVEEERTQNRFESFALYANGFRVWPIMSACELMDFNSTSDLKSSLKFIIRDYDLQFPDADVEEHEELKVEEMRNDENLVDYIRGAKYIEERGKWRTFDGECKDSKGNEKNHFWCNLKAIPKFFISKGVDQINIVTAEEKYRKKRNDENDNPETLSQFQNGVLSQTLRGMYKPVTGIYRSFQNFETIKARYDEGVRWDTVRRNVEKIEKQINKIDRKQDVSLVDSKTLTPQKTLIEKTKEYYIQTSRKEHHHGVPLDIYDLIKGMIDRARLYQEKGKFVFSAMVAQEALEILNGFHESLMLKAYHIYAVSENAVCMNLLGGNELWLKQDAEFRVHKIQHDLKRMLARTNENIDRKGLIANILNQIYSDCRQFCKKKEHFSSEAVFIGAMGYQNEGYNLYDIKDEIKEIGRKFINACISFYEVIKKYKRLKVKKNG